MPDPFSSKAQFPAHRPNAAVVLFNHHGQVLMCRRAGERGRNCWQFPQGGIDDGEKPLDAAIRELEEETGIGKKYVVKIGKYKGWLPYDFPANIKFAPSKRKQWLGQKQRWYAFLFLGKDSQIRLDAHKSVEFDKWMWIDLEKTPARTIKWKRRVYHKLVDKFAPLARLLKLADQAAKNAK